MSTAESLNYGRLTIECQQGDITDQADMQAVVNAANAQLMPGSGVAGAIHRRAGPGLMEECEPLAPIRPGEAVITSAHNLPNRHIIHCLGPVYGVDQPEEELLAACYRNALGLAEANGLQSIAFPALSTGAFGYPMEDAARVTMEAIRDFGACRNLERIRFVLWSQDDLTVFIRAMEHVLRNHE